MADSRKFIRAFLASPGDLGDERRAAKAVVDEFNSNWAEYLGYNVELIGWEDTISGYGRPQATINRDLERCELFIGMLWKRWGTPPDKSGEYSSGFEEEFRISVSNKQKRDSPEISLFFKKVDTDLINDPGDDLKKVIAFKDSIISEKVILFETFDGIEEFQGKIRRCIAHYIQELKLKETRERPQQEQAPPAEGSAPQDLSEATPPPETPFSYEGAKFLQGLISKTEDGEGQEPITTAEVARFRLLASIIRKQGNEEQFLGVHDANILFVHRADLKLSSRERFGLIYCGFDHYTSENTPLWYWLAKVDAFNRSLLQFFSYSGTASTRIGALHAMQLVSEPLSSANHWDKEACISLWFSETSEGNLKAAALRYLGDCGTTADLPVIKEEFDRADRQTTSAAVEAMLRIKFRDSRENAILALFEFQPESIASDLLTALFQNSDSIDTTILTQGIGHRSSAVRRVVVKLLRRRQAMGTEVADQLISDSDAEVRFEALLALFQNGRQFSDNDAKRILVKHKRYQYGGLLGAFGATDSEGEAYWDQFREQRMAAMANSDLEEVATNSSIFDRTAQFLLTERQFAKFGDSLRTAIDDNFKTEFDKEVEELARKFGRESDSVEKTRNSEEHLRKKFTRAGLDIICRKGEPQDLKRVRNILRSGFVSYSEIDIAYLQKYGEWDDVSLIIEMLDRPSSNRRSASLLFAPDDGRYQVAARAIYGLGRSRFGELLSLLKPDRLLSHLIVVSSEKVFRELSDSSITQLFRSEHDAVRKAAALKCVRALPKIRLTQLLGTYISGDWIRYYNVIHWLDFGASVPRDRARSAADKVLVREWNA